MSLPKQYDARRTDLMISFVPFAMNVLWFTKILVNTNVHAQSLKSPARGRRVYAEAPDYEDVAERVGLN